MSGEIQTAGVFAPRVIAGSGPAGGNAVPAKRFRLATTPGRIVAGLVAVAAVVVLALAVNLAVTAHTAQAIQTLGSDAEPSVVLALRISAVLGDLDATAADDALSGGASATGTSLHWREDKAALDGLVIQAARNITYPAESEAIAGLLRWVGEYQQSLAEVRGVAAQPWTATQRLQWSHRLVRGFAMPQADALADANIAPLLHVYGAYQASVLPLAAAAAISLAAVLVVLVVLQLFLTRHTKRLINVPLAAASLVVAALLAGAAASGLAEREDVRSAKADCYDSLHALFAARAVETAMNADLALWVLDPATREATAQAFDAGAHRLLDLGLHDQAAAPRPLDPTAVTSYLDALGRAQAEESAGHPEAALRTLPRVHGLLADELANVTFGPAERDPASQAVLALDRAVQVSDRVRQLMLGGQDMEAVSLRATEGEAAFAQLDGAIARAAAVNQAEFDSHIAGARLLLGWTPLAVCVGLLLAGALAALGLWQRLSEYR